MNNSDKLFQKLYDLAKDLQVCKIIPPSSICPKLHRFTGGLKTIQNIRPLQQCVAHTLPFQKSPLFKKVSLVPHLLVILVVYLQVQHLVLNVLVCKCFIRFSQGLTQRKSYKILCYLFLQQCGQKAPYPKGINQRQGNLNGWSKTYYENTVSMKGCSQPLLYVAGGS